MLNDMMWYRQRVEHLSDQKSQHKRGTSNNTAILERKTAPISYQCNLSTERKAQTLQYTEKKGKKWAERSPRPDPPPLPSGDPHNHPLK